LKNIPIYVINYKDNDRRNRMIHRFKLFDVEPIFPSAVETTDERIKSINIPNKRVCSIMLQHLDAVQLFYEKTQAEYCIVCEDDIYISNTFDKDIESIIQSNQTLKLDLILLGYLLPFKIDMNSYLHKQYFTLIHTDDNFSYHTYPNDIWGAQMYLITRPYAKFLLETFTIEYALKPGSQPYNPDWTITKNGKRAIINPMIAVEEGVNKSSDDCQIRFHSTCSAVHYDKEHFI